MSSASVTKPKILVQLDPDTHPSVFDAVVAIDSGVDHLLQYRGVTPGQVRALVHGCIFTRGGEGLASTAIFIGGSQIAAGEALLGEVLASFFGPMQVSVMLDASGANTTAAAAVLAASKHLNLAEISATVLGGTGPVGQRVARLLAKAGAKVRLASRAMERAEIAVNAIRERYSGASISAVKTSSDDETSAAIAGSQLVIAAGAAGIVLLKKSQIEAAKELQVVVDLNAVPPLGIEGVKMTDKAASLAHVIAYGALGVGGTKMKIHRACVASLFESNTKVLDAEAIFEVGQTL